MTQAEYNAWIRARFNLWTKSDVDAEVRKAVEQALAQRTWVGLTDEQIDACWNKDLWKEKQPHHIFAKAIEAKLKERNT